LRLDVLIYLVVNAFWCRVCILSIAIVTITAPLFCLFPEVFEQYGSATFGSVCDVVYDGVDTFLETVVPLLIDMLRDEDLFSFYTRTG
jgi:hypothetical protein